MDSDVVASREAVSRRRALAIGGSLGLGGVLAAFGMSEAHAAASAGASSVDSQITALLKKSSACSTDVEMTQGPYWFDVDSIRSDVRDGRPGLPVTLALRVLDVAGCSTAAQGRPIPNSVVEIWHCDAGGVYSGFEAASKGQGGGMPGSGGGMPGSGSTSNGSYSKGDLEASATDDGTYLRGAQVADARGIVRFTTIFPGWYRGRTVHIHVKVHLDKKTVLTTQVFFDESVNSAVNATAPYRSHTGRDTFNSNDSIFRQSGILTTARLSKGLLAVTNIGVDV